MAMASPCERLTQPFARWVSLDIAREFWLCVGCLHESRGAHPSEPGTGFSEVGNLGDIDVPFRQDIIVILHTIVVGIEPWRAEGRSARAVSRGVGEGGGGVGVGRM